MPSIRLSIFCFSSITLVVNGWGRGRSFNFAFMCCVSGRRDLRRKTTSQFSISLDLSKPVFSMHIGKFHSFQPLTVSLTEQESKI